MQNIYKKEIITVNQLKQEIIPVPILSTNEIEHIKKELLQNEKFIFSTYNNISLKILLLSDMINLVSNIAGTNPRYDLKRICENIQSSLKIKPNRKHNNSFHLSKTEKVDHPMNKLTLDFNDVNYEDIAERFCFYFKGHKDLTALRKFYHVYKNDRVMSYFLSYEMISNFFKMVQEKYDDPYKIEDLLVELKNKAYELQNKKTKQNFNFFIQILQEIHKYNQSVENNEIVSERKNSVSNKTKKQLRSLNTLVSKNNPQQIEKLKIMNSLSSSSEFDRKSQKKSEEYIKLDTLEQISTNNGYKSAYLLNHGEKTEKKENEKTDNELFEETRNIIKAELMGQKSSLDESKKEMNFWEIRRNKSNNNDNGEYLRDMLKFSMKKNQIARSLK